MIVFDFLQANFAAFLLLALVIGLIVGSFLNVVIHRLPKMMEQQWHRDCDELKGLASEEATETEVYNLNTPASHCPKCQHKIRPWENIPVISWLLLKGRCSNCQNPISVRYPIIEAVTGLLSLWIAFHFGFSWEAIAALLLTWSLIALTVIDFDVQLLPDNITLPFLWLGLLVNINGLFTDLESAVIGAIAGYMALWSVFQLFKKLTGKEGMGYGD
ncbi:MAG: prepilin peptidase, partial [Candidatus Thiodiazotropha taylori]|nr:prepilin peptidase [Candidatus Thiodiazotropha taylori]